MPSPHSIRRLARVSRRVQQDIRRGGMAITFKYLFRSTSILARVVTMLAEEVAELAAEVEQLQRAAGRAPVGDRGARTPAGRRA